MSTDLARKLSPEETEAEKKRSEVNRLEVTLVERQLQMATLKARLQAFEHKYMRMVGVLYADLDAVEAAIAHLHATLHPQEGEAQERYRQAEARAKASEREARAELDTEAATEFLPTDDLKRLYRDCAMQLHPDMGTGAEDRESRTRFMAELNAAFAACDANLMREILDRWKNRVGMAAANIGSELIRLIRKIAHLEEAIRQIDEQIVQLNGSDLSKLQNRVDTLRAVGRDLLEEMHQNAQQKIDIARKRLSAMKAGTQL
ncbi:MAG: molecular chaperone DnaJ [Chthonomonadaceae bacterium]|nr:molecular chaperone DnaJ [Chthonomonadaceae bacterium]